MERGTEGVRRGWRLLWEWRAHFARFGAVRSSVHTLSLLALANVSWFVLFVSCTVCYLAFVCLTGVGARRLPRWRLGFVREEGRCGSALATLEAAAVL